MHAMKKGIVKMALCGYQSLELPLGFEEFYRCTSSIMKYRILDEKMEYKIASSSTWAEYHLKEEQLFLRNYAGMP